MILVPSSGLHVLEYTVKPHYIEVQGTSSKCSIYPEFDIRIAMVVPAAGRRESDVLIDFDINDAAVEVWGGAAYSI